jgi:hypothetical protein
MQLRVPESMSAGTKVKCPKCSVTFETPDPATAPPQPPPSPFQHEQYSEAPLPPPAPSPTPSSESTYRAGDPTVDDVPPGAPHYRAPGWQRDDLEGGLYFGRGIEGLSPDYEIDLGQLYNRTKEHYRAIVGPMIGYQFLFWFISLFVSALGNIPCIGPLIQLALQITVLAPLEAGFVIVSLAELKGRNWSFGDFFSGFNWFGPIALVQLLIVVAALAIAIPAGVIAAIFMIGMQRQNNPAAVAAIVVGAILLLALIMAYFAIRLTLFSTPLIVDRNCGPIEAMQGSWRLTAGHFWGWFGVLFLLGLAQMGPMMPGLALLIAGAANNVNEMMIIGGLVTLLGGIATLIIMPFTRLFLVVGYQSAVGIRREVETGPV